MKTLKNLDEVKSIILGAKDYGTTNPEAQDTHKAYYEFSDELDDYVPTVKIARALGISAEFWMEEDELVTADGVTIEVNSWCGIPFLRTEKGMLAYIKV